MYHKTANMLATLSVLLGFLIAMSLGQTPDCKKDPLPNRDICCSNFVKFASDFGEGDCVIQHKAGYSHWQAECDFTICIMKKKEYLLSDNKIDRAALTKFVKQNLTDYGPNIETHLEKCYTDTKISECTPLAFLVCAANVLMKECPSAFWGKSEECTILKNHYNNCPSAVFFPNIME